MTGTGGKRPRNLLDNAPEDLPESVMAPPLKAKRQRLIKVWNGRSQHASLFF
jgi:hypothetical protein